jgi:hypothetical protein
VSAALLLKPSTFIFGKNSFSNTPLTPRQSPSLRSVQSYTREMFEPYIGDIFRVRVGKHLVRLKLEAVENVSPASGGITNGTIVPTDCFSVRFHSASPLQPSARIHRLNHRKLGSFDLYMIQSNKGGKFLQTAIVNHLV